MSAENSLRRCRTMDILGLKDWMCQAVDWYVHNADRLSEMSDFFLESEGDVLSSILSLGMKELEMRMDILSEAKRGDEL